MARYEYLLNWQPSSSREAWGPPQARPLRRLSDAYFGVADVTGAKVVTSSGVLEVKLLPTIAPAAVRNFVDLAEAGFFDGQIFHQVVPGLIAETGDPHGTGLGGPGYTIRDEYSLTPFGRGSLGMARASKDKAGSRWFISQRREPQFDGRYTNFGQVTDGWAVLDHIRLGDTIESIVIQRRSQ